MTDEKGQRLQSAKNSNYFVLDAPEGQAEIAELVCHHRGDFLAADLSQQAAMIRFIRTQLARDYSDGFVDPQGDPLDDDAINLGIARVFYQNSSHDNDNGIAAVAVAAAVMKPPSRRSRDTLLNTTTPNNDTMHAETVEPFDDGAIYEYLNHLRNKPTQRLSPSPTFSATSKRKPRKSSSKQAVKRATSVKSKKIVERKPRAREKMNKGVSTEEGTGNAFSTVGGGGAVFPNAEEIHSRAMALLAETQSTTSIPKGVTVRPSGRWQSQVYYKGQSRYLGVYTDSCEAAMAWTVAKKLLSEVDVKGASKTDTDKFYSMVKEIVGDLVQGTREAQE